MKLAPQDLLFPYDSYGNLNPFVERFLKDDEIIAKRYRAGYIPPLDRAGKSHEINALIRGLESTLTNAGIKISEQQSRQALCRTIVLNPNITVENSRFVLNGDNEGNVVTYYIGPHPDEHDPARETKWHVRVEQKRYLLESLAKAVVGETGLSKDDFDSVAGALNNPVLFSDNKSYDSASILTPIEHHQGIELGDRPGSGWRPTVTRIPFMMGRHRGYVLEANQKYFKEMLERFQVPVRERQSLEVCCGWGNFRAMMPRDIWPTVVHMDWNPAFLDYIRRLDSSANLKEGNVYAIPYDNESFKNIFGLTPFVSLWFLDHAIQEISRVLEKNGRFFAFQDILPNDPQMAEQLIKRGLHPLRNNYYSLREIDDSDFFDKLKQEFDMRYPSTSNGWKEYKRKFNGQMVMQSPFEYLEAWLINELKYAGFQVLYAGPETVYDVELRQLHHVDQTPVGEIIDPNIVFREHKSDRGPIIHDSSYPTLKYQDIRTAIGPNRLLQRSTFWAVIAEKN